MTKVIKFEVCPGCGKHGHIIVGGYILPEVHCQEHARAEVACLRVHHLITEEEEMKLMREIAAASLPTWAHLMKEVVSEVTAERADPEVVTRLLQQA